MLSIGEFSKACAVSTKALRHYDAIGLIKPMHVDAQNGYRYYDTAQLDDMLLIARLKRYGFSLGEIGRILRARDRAYLEACLSAQRILLAKRMQAQRDVLEELDGYLHDMEGKAYPMIHTNIDLVETSDTAILSIRARMALDDFGKQYGKLYERIGALGVAPEGHLAIYHDTEFDPEHSDIEVGIAIGDRGKADRVIAGRECAHIAHRGAYSTLNESYAALTRWIEENGYAIADAPYERYIIGPQSGQPTADWVTDIYFPVRKK